MEGHCFNFGLDKFIKKLKTEFQDVKSNANMERLKTDLTDVQDVLAQSIDMMINRENKLTGIENNELQKEIYS